MAVDEMAVLSQSQFVAAPCPDRPRRGGGSCAAPLGPNVLQRTGIRISARRICVSAWRQERFTARTSHRRSGDHLAGSPPMWSRCSPSEALTSVAVIRGLAGRLSGRDVPKLLDYADSLDSVVVACRQSAAAALRAIRVQVGLGETMDVLDSGRREADRSTHADDLLALESVAGSTRMSPPSNRGSETCWHGRPGGPVVHLSTIHKIKGREWEHVIVYGASRTAPAPLSDDEEGERRVFHVGLTRAIRQVLVLADADEPSPFVAELDRSRPHTRCGSRSDRAWSRGRVLGGDRISRAASAVRRGRPRLRRECWRRSVSCSSTAAIQELWLTSPTRRP